MKEYKYIRMELREEKPKTKVWAVLNKTHGSLLGAIGWHGSWRQYCFFPCGDIVFSKGCLEDICDFIKEVLK